MVGNWEGRGPSRLGHEGFRMSLEITAPPTARIDSAYPFDADYQQGTVPETDRRAGARRRSSQVYV